MIAGLVSDAFAETYAVEKALNGLDGLMMVRSIQPDIILLDIELGDIDGYRVCRKLKSVEELKDIPVIFVSSAQNPLDKMKAFSSGGVDYITKPIEIVELEARVNAHLTIRALQLDLEHKIQERTRKISEKQAALKEKNRALGLLLKDVKESEDRYRTLIEAANDGICVIEADRFVDCNSRLAKMFKTRRRNIIGRRPDHFAPKTQPDGSDSKETARQKLAAAKEGIPQIFDWHHQDSAGQLLATEICLNATSFKGVTYVLGIVRDVTRRKEIEQALGRRTDELLKANQALQAMLDYRDTEKQAFEKTMMARLEQRVMPYLLKLEEGKLSGAQANYLQLLKANLNELIPSSGNTLASALVKLAPTEVKIADLIRLGNQTKEIAEILHMTPKTVSRYRGNIRKKLDLANRKINLRTYLESLSA